MNKYKQISEARKILEIPETATMALVKSNYRMLLTRWHPDKCDENQEVCAEMTRKIISAYKTIMDYCREYQYSFSKEQVKKHLSPEEWWMERFGQGPK